MHVWVMHSMLCSTRCEHVFLRHGPLTALWYLGRVQTEFIPNSTLTTYVDFQDCGPRGDDAYADLDQCVNGYVLVHTETRGGTINSCEYFSWKIYMCNEPGELPAPYLIYM